jgi:CheY-like chemotaxis protein
MNDLFFSATINDIAKRFGMTVEFVKSKELAFEKVKSKPAIVIFDLNCAEADPIGLLLKIKEDSETNAIPTIGFVSHVQTELKEKAQEIGCDVVMARSVFAQKLPAILERYASAGASSRN